MIQHLGGAKLKMANLLQNIQACISEARLLVEAEQRWGLAYLEKLSVSTFHPKMPILSSYTHHNDIQTFMTLFSRTQKKILFLSVGFSIVFDLTDFLCWDKIVETFFKKSSFKHFD